MKRTIQLIALTAGLTASAPEARAQRASVLPPAQSAIVCDRRSPIPLSYHDCALWLDDRFLRRGAAGDVVAKEKGLHPIRLTGLVTGDSARWYAGQYEQAKQTQMTIGAIGISLIAASVITAGASNCGGIHCYTNGKGHTVRLLAISGASFSLFALPFKTAARRSGTRAIWWNNELLGR